MKKRGYIVKDEKSLVDFIETKSKHEELKAISQGHKIQDFDIYEASYAGGGGIDLDYFRYLEGAQMGTVYDFINKEFRSV